MPSELSSLALGNRKQLYDLLFASAWTALKETIEAEHGYEPAALMVLHTWNQRLEAHSHVHAVVPGGGPALDGSGWVHSRRPEGASSAGDYLVDAVVLRRRYRDRFLASLTRLRRRGELKLQGDFQHLQDDEAWQAFLRALQSIEWVSYIQPPPRQEGGKSASADQVLKYLARYLTGGPISDGRILQANDNEVVFWAREGKTPGGDRQCVPIRLSAVEFTRRWCLHILPKGYTKTRRFGGWSNRRCDSYVERCAKMLEAANAPLSDDAVQFDPFLEHDQLGECQDYPECPDCGGRLRWIERREKPSWHAVLTSSSRPNWYPRDAL